jgi:hypothetical protein
LNPFIKESIVGSGFVWGWVSVKVSVGLGGADGEGSGVGLDGVGGEERVGVAGAMTVAEAVGASAVGVDARVSDATGPSWVGDNIIGAFGLQPASSAAISSSITNKRCFIITVIIQLLGETKKLNLYD